jgi:hypothetical protein
LVVRGLRDIVLKARNRGWWWALAGWRSYLAVWLVAVGVVVLGGWGLMVRENGSLSRWRRRGPGGSLFPGRDAERLPMTAGSRSKTAFPFKSLGRFAESLYRARELAGLDQREAAKRAASPARDSTRSRAANTSHQRRPDPPRRRLLDLGGRPRRQRRLVAQLGRGFRVSGIPGLGRRGNLIKLRLLDG